ncbi:MAG: RNB domain-containing ribonuclease [Neisseriaceae bacterium]|nr:RNB domain-containing ribonuclease [Neisseriaceae bacterium]
MNILFENSGQYVVAEVLKENVDSFVVRPHENCQINKIKASKVITTFEEPLSQFWEKAHIHTDEYNYVDIWKKLQGQIFNAKEFLNEYLGYSANVYQLAGFILLLSQQPLYFYRKGGKSFQAAKKDILEKALKAQQKKLEKQKKIDGWKHDLLKGNVPQEVQQDIFQIVFEQTKYLDTYQAFNLAAKELNLCLKELAVRLGLFEDSLSYLMHEFIHRNDYLTAEHKNLLLTNNSIIPKNDTITAFSIDSEDTSEIDDAISIFEHNQNTITIGVHIALPSFAIRSNPELEKQVFNNMSSVYLPHMKLTLLPENWIEFFSLTEKQYKPVISAYFKIDKKSGDILEKYSRVEKIHISQNIHLETLESLDKNNDLDNQENNKRYSHFGSDKFLWLFEWCKNNQEKRLINKPDTRSNQDFLVKVKENQIIIKEHQRDHPINIMVSELMILANGFWANELKKHQIPAIYRAHEAKENTAYFTDQPKSHAPMDLECYAWFTSPLRRSVDYINQMQLLSILMPETCQQLSFSQEEVRKWILAFQSKYSYIQQFQKRIEYYWCLKAIQKEQLKYLKAKVHKKGVLKALSYPLKFRNMNIPNDTMQNDVVTLEVKKLDVDNLYMDLQFCE